MSQHRRPPPQAKLNGKGRGVLLALVALVFVGILAGAGLAAGHLLGGGGSSASSASKDYSGSGSGRTVIRVQQGDSASDIGRTLVSDGVVASVGAFTTAATANTSSTGIQPGLYALRLKMSGSAALDLLLTPAALVTERFTVPEGTSLKNLPAIIAKTTPVTVAEVTAAIAAPTSLGLPSYAGTSVEGFLFPATYDVEPGASATTVLQLMTTRFAQEARTVDLVGRARALGITPLQAVTIASIIQRESASATDGPRVARVFYNRIKAGMPLGSEFTVAYAGGSKTSPYNTYTHAGIPPGPYDSPGQTALSSALNPAGGTALFFVTLPKEGTKFVDTESQFFALQRTCQAEGGCTG